tara:strand:- start:1522 stop:1737 length:216 start_codon:yes stop_codon:yes gene_type:complete
MTESSQEYLNKKIIKIEKQIYLHIERINKNNSTEGLSEIETFKNQLVMLEIIFSYLHRKLKRLNKELESKI